MSTETLKKVFIETLWSLRGATSNFIDSAPDGYEFVLKPQIEETLFKEVITPNPWLFRLGKSVNRFIPYRVIIPWMQSLRRPPAGTVLTYGYNHLVFRPGPWVVEAECAGLLVVSRMDGFNRFRHLLERSLAASDCKKIICWSEAGQRTIVEGLNSEQFRHKVELVYYAAPTRPFVKTYTLNKTVKIIFVGTQSPARPWRMGEGTDLLEAFSILRQNYDVEMIVRAPVPPEIKAKYEGIEGLTIFDQLISRGELERALSSADICVMPYPTTTPHALLDVMSFELPIVAKDSWANPEYVQNGITGLLVQPSRRTPFYYNNTCHPDFGRDTSPENIKDFDRNVVEELVKKLSLLIENPEMRRGMGKAARHEVEEGKFSMRIRKAKLGKIFDEAIAET